MSTPNTKGSKMDFFQQLDALNQSDSDNSTHDEEEQYRKNSRLFRRFSTSKDPSSSRPSSSHSASAATSLTGVGFPPRRTISDPIPGALGTSHSIIKGTPSSAYARKAKATLERVAAVMPSSVVDDTPVGPSKTRPVLSRQPANTSVHSSDLASLASSREQSPSVGTNTKKRKRGAAERAVATGEQIFRGLSFFYVPNNDIAPARKVRIGKARDFGAVWTRMVSSATHVVVDSNLSYKDVEQAIAGEDISEATLVNESFPLDCIHFRALLNHRQTKYQVPGSPSNAPASVDKVPPQSSGESASSLPLKAPQTDRSRWDFVPRPGTPSQLSGEDRPLEPASSTGRRNSQPHSSPPELQESGAKGINAQEKGIAAAHTVSPSDELSGYIDMMKAYKDVPLDDDDDSDTVSVRMRELSDSDSLSEDEGSRSKAGPSGAAISKQKAISFEDRFTCSRGGTLTSPAENPNATTIEVLKKMCDYYDRVNDQWRTIAYRKAISVLNRQTERITTAEEAYKLPSVGRRLAAKIEEIVTTNRLKRLEYAQSEPLDAVLQLFLGIYGVGTRQAMKWISQGHRTLGDLLSAANLTQNQRMGIEHYDDLNSRIPRSEVKALGDYVKHAAAQLDPQVELIIGGSYRRGAPTSSDIDFVVTKKGTSSSGDLAGCIEALISLLYKQGFLVATVASLHSRSRDGEGSKWHGCCVLPRTPALDDESYRPVWRRIDFLLVPETELGAALLYFTGNDIFNRSIRLLASKKGMRLNQRGLYKDVMRGPGRVKVTGGQLLEGQDEKRIFEILGVTWREPHERWC